MLEDSNLHIHSIVLYYVQKPLNMSVCGFKLNSLGNSHPSRIFSAVKRAVMSPRYV